MSTDYDVIIVGAGFAGVTAARELGRRGARCLLLEARDRLGGRTWTGEFAGQRVEFGGAWIHWCQPHVWAEVARYGLAIVESPRPENVAWLARGERKTGSLGDVMRFVGALGNAMQDSILIERPYDPRWYEPAEFYDDQTVQKKIDSLGLAPEEADMVSATLSSAGPCDQASLLGFLHLFALSLHSAFVFADATARFKFRDGTRALIDAMVREGKPELTLSAPVARVAQERAQVVATTRSGQSYTARAMVVAVPVATLGAIEFSPALSTHKRDAAREGHAGIHLKTWALVEGAPKKFFGIGKSTFSMLATEYELPEGTLVVAFGPNADALDISDPRAVERAVRAYAPEARVIKVAGHDWLHDPYSRGAGFLWRAGQVRRLGPHLAAAEGRLVFAGADVAYGWPSIDGAIESGLRAAREAGQLLGDS